MNPGYQITWIILVLTLPIFGVFMYLFYGRRQARIRIAKEMKELNQDMLKKLNITNKPSHTLQELKSIDSHRYRQAFYIQNCSSFPIYKNSECCYYSPGDEFYPMILQELTKAKHSIYIEFFTIEISIFWDQVLKILEQKVSEGIDVRVIYDDIGSLLTLPKHYNKTLQAKGISCAVFNPYKPIITTFTNNRDHQKIIVIDGESAITGGFNLADEYINLKKKSGFWKDSALLLKGEAAQSFLAMFLSTWESIHNSINKNNIAQDLKSSHLPLTNGYVQPFRDTPLDNECASQAILLSMIYNAVNYLYITTPYLMIDHEIITALCNAAKSGVDVRILTPHIPDRKLVHMITKSYYSILISNGVKIYEFTPGFIHSKSVVADDAIAMVGTINLDYRSLYLHFECGVVMYGTNCIQDILSDFKQTQKISEVISLNSIANRTWYEKLIASFFKIFAPLF
jgi:cardiolipin synthase